MEQPFLGANITFFFFFFHVSISFSFLETIFEFFQDFREKNMTTAWLAKAFLT